MSNNPPEIDPADLKHFAFVVDGAVAHIVSIPAPRVNISEQGNELLELWQSRPLIVEVPDDLENFGRGYIWDGETFKPPTAS
jgi:hypothetical protein